MKKTILLLLILISTQITLSQENYKKPYFTGSFNTTFAINEDYTLDPDDDESFLIPSAFMIRLGAGYQFHRRWQIGINAGFDHHLRYNINAIPLYGSIRYNIFENDNDNFFAEYSQGKMWRPSSSYENGNYYGFGIGTQITGSGRWNFVIRIDYHRKAIENFENGHLDSVSLGVGFSFF